jgi:hypothetical protein
MSDITDELTNSAEKSAERVESGLEIRIATASDTEELAWLNQELLTFYGLPARNQRSFVSHAIAKGVFEANSGLKILLAIENGNAIGFLAFSEIFALASCQKSIFIQDLFVARKSA